jgi:hypothetical protein
MPEVNGLTIHERAPAHDAWDAPLGALLNRRLGYAPLTERAVKPYGANLALCRLLDYLNGHRRMSGDHDAIKAARDTGEVRITGDTFDLGDVGVDGQRLISRVTELPVNRIGSAVRRSRHAGYSDSLPLQEVGDGLWNARHWRLPPGRDYSLTSLYSETLDRCCTQPAGATLRSVDAIELPRTALLELRYREFILRPFLQGDQVKRREHVSPATLVEHGHSSFWTESCVVDRSDAVGDRLHISPRGVEKEKLPFVGFGVAIVRLDQHDFRNGVS